MKRVIEDLDQKESDIKKAQSIMIKYDSINKTKRIAKEYCLKAESILNDFPKNIYNQALVELTKFVFSREN